MNSEEILEKNLKKFKKVVKKFTKSLKTKEAARKYLIDAGFYTKSGKISKKYR